MTADDGQTQRARQAHQDPPEDDQPPENVELPGWLGWVAWGVGAVALYALLLGRVTLDAFDAEYPHRDVVRAGAAEDASLPFEVADGAEDDAEIRDALSVLPELLTMVAEQKQIRIVITDLKAIEAHGVSPGEPMSHVAGYFSRDDWRLHVAHDASRPGMVALHEFGHFVDAALDDCAQAPAFDAIYRAAVDEGELGRHIASSPRETFAYMFEQYFFSDRRRARLEDRYPEGYAFMEELATTGECPSVESGLR